VAADRLAAAFIEIGAGDDPEQWIRVVNQAVDNPGGRIGVIPADRFSGARNWTIRLVVIGANGQQREARFRLALG